MNGTNFPLPGNTQGVLWALASTALFAVVAAMAKIAVQDYHVLQILFFRQIVVFLSSLPSISTSFPNSLKTRFPVLHGIRLAGAFVALAGSIWAVSVLPLTTAATLGFAQVLFVVVLAALFLRESVGPHRIAAVIAGFVGVIFVMRPAAGGIIDIHAAIPVVAAMGAAIAVISVRRLSQTDTTATLLVYQAVSIGILAGIPLFWLWKTPDLPGLLLLLSMGILSSAGQWIGVQSLRLGEASVIGNIQYVQLVYAAILGFVLFGEIPDQKTLIGAVVIIASSIYLVHRERINQRKAST